MEFKVEVEAKFENSMTKTYKFPLKSEDRKKSPDNSLSLDTTKQPMKCESPKINISEFLK